MQLILSQISLGFIAFSLVSIFYCNINASIAAVLGIAIAVIPSLIYIKVAHKATPVPAIQYYAAHKKALLYKFLVNLLSFTLVLLIFRSKYILALFLTYIITLSGSWLVLLIRPGKA
jgi:F0F1-type ATP synthase assembly protein I